VCDVGERHMIKSEIDKLPESVLEEVFDGLLLFAV
jgi:hypothetical protein